MMKINYYNYKKFNIRLIMIFNEFDYYLIKFKKLTKVINNIF